MSLVSACLSVSNVPAHQHRLFTLLPILSHRHWLKSFAKESSTSSETDAMGHEKPVELSRAEFESIVRDGSYVEEDTLEDFPTKDVVDGVNRELDLMNSFPVYQAVLRGEMTGNVWSTRWCYRRKGPKQVRARFVVRQFATSLDATFYCPTPGLEVTRVLLAMAVSKDPYHFVR